MLLSLVALAWAGPTTSVEVRNAESGQALAGALVTVAGSDIIATTDNTGRCLVVAHVGRGARLVTARAGFFSDTLVVTPAIRRDTVIVVSLHPDRARALRVSVTDATAGVALTGAAVAVQGGPVLTTGGDGSVLFLNVAHGARYVRAEMEGWTVDSQVVVARGGETTDVVLRLRDTTNVGDLVGAVTDQTTGKPVAGAVVRLDASGLVAVSDSIGEYRLERLSAGVYDVSVSCDGYRRGVARFRMLKGWTVNLNLRLYPASSAGR